TDFGTVTDTLPPQLTIVSMTHNGGGTPTQNGQTITWPVGVLQPGQTVTLTIVTRLAGAGTNAACRPDGPQFVSNEACLTSGICAEISVFCEPSTLPATGESSSAVWRWLALAALATLLLGLITQHRRLHDLFRGQR
ncbi:MAG: DUF11 domain-containing protein, partial [Anaerolineae bacterium]|nr:DUF11 domain-containing protein [Anaerolineae bacterium]